MNEVIPVQPREIVDLVYRIARVDGLDHGDANLVARWVTCEELAGRSRLDGALRAPSGLLSAAKTADRRGETDPSAADGYHHASRQGLPIATAQFSALYDASKMFLVAEATLDEVER
ncbi:MAG: hypothetical protein CL433_08940 [Acidimicrobiaceae bacterium]|nr:hypothetical protein [Acidimicrobiaceae bacterium]HAB58164.1 hypothetical protein [Acidimicrobiaceae bacterium]